MLLINQYINDVLSGKIVTGEFIKLACQRHLDDLKRVGNDDFPYYFDEKHAAAVIRFIEVIRHYKGEWAGQRIKLEPHQHFYFGSIFGWKHKDTKLRRFKTVFKEVARKNGKTTEAAIIAIVHLILDNESGAAVYATATKEEQARIVVNDAGKLIEETPELRNVFRSAKYHDEIKRVFKTDLSGVILANGRDSKKQDGTDPSIGIADEVHEHDTEERINVIEGGMAARSQPLMVLITTAGFNKEYPCYKTIRKTSIEILKGIKKDDRYFTLMYELDEGDDWNDKSVWPKSNPNYGVSVHIEYLEDRYLKAKNQGGALEVEYKTKNLNMWVDAPEVWIPDDTIKKCMTKLPDLKALVGYGGLDIAGAGDLNALCLEFEKDGKFFGLLRFWCPKQKVIDNKDKVDYATWEREGWLKTTPGNVIDYSVIVSDIINLCKVYDINSIAFDPNYASNNIIFELIDEGIEMNKMSQSIQKISQPTKDWWEEVVQGRWFFENPILRWMFSNAYCHTDANENWKLIKPAHRTSGAPKSSGKIDGLIASLMAHGEYTTFNQTGTSKYETEEMIVL